jgi:hypothetical protein
MSPVDGMTTVSSGGLFRDEKAPTSRCISCGAFGPVPLCEKHFNELMVSLDYYARGAFKKLIDAHMSQMSEIDKKEMYEQKKAELDKKRQELEQMEKDLNG